MVGRSAHLGFGITHNVTPSRFFCGASQVEPMVKKPPAMQETQVLSLGGEDPLEKGMATHSSSLAWRIPWTEEPGGLQFMRVKESPPSDRHFHFHYGCF